MRKLGDPTPVDEKTLFAIGSSSKAFTAASIAMLVDEGKLKWDDPATKYLPGFQLFDPYATRELSVRDLLSHRSGLERGDLLWYGTSYSRDEIVQRVRYLKPSWSFRSKFGYQNIMYLAAGQIVAGLSGKPWDDFIRDRIFKPLGMTSSSTSIKNLKAASDVATPHAKLDGKVESISWRNIDNIAPAGSINSNVIDMAQWVRLQLGEGSYKGQRLISSGGAKALHTAQAGNPYKYERHSASGRHSQPSLRSVSRGPTAGLQCRYAEDLQCFPRARQPGTEEARRIAGEGNVPYTGT